MFHDTKIFKIKHLEGIKNFYQTTVYSKPKENSGKLTIIILRFNMALDS